MKLPEKSDYTFENKNEAKTELMNKNKKTIESPLPSAGIEKMNVYISFWSPLNLLNILSILVTLITLKILAICGKTDKTADEAPPDTPMLDSMRSKTDAMTTKKSKIFHPE